MSCEVADSDFEIFSEHFFIFLHYGITKLSDLQLELLKVYSFQTNEEDLLAIKQMLAKYFSEKLINKIDTAITNNNISEQDINKWLDK